MRESTDQELIFRYQSSPDRPEGRSSIERLTERYAEKISRWCLQAVGNAEDAADCAQDTLVRVFNGLASFKGKSAFSTWVYTVTRKTCLNTLARRRAQRSRDDNLNQAFANGELRAESKTEVDPARSLQVRETEMLFHAMFESHISLEESQAMRLHHVDGHSMKSVTSILGLMNSSGARAVLARAKRKLRQHISIEYLQEIGYAIAPPQGRRPGESGGESTGNAP